MEGKKWRQWAWIYYPTSFCHHAGPRRARRAAFRRRRETPPMAARGAHGPPRPQSTAGASAPSSASAQASRRFRLTAGRVEAVDLDALAASTGDREAHDFVAFLHDFDGCVGLLARRRPGPTGFARPAARRDESRRQAQGLDRKVFSALKKWFHNTGFAGFGVDTVAGVPGLGGFAPRVFEDRVRLRVTRWLDCSSGATPGSGFVSA